MPIRRWNMLITVYVDMVNMLIIKCVSHRVYVEWPYHEDHRTILVTMATGSVSESPMVSYSGLLLQPHSSISKTYIQTPWSHKLISNCFGHCLVHHCVYGRPFPCFFKVHLLQVYIYGQITMFNDHVMQKCPFIPRLHHTRYIHVYVLRLSMLTYFIK